MKAEERKELETNVLAAKLGTFVKTAKKGPSKRLFFYVLAAIGVVIGLVMWNLYRNSAKRQESVRWTEYLIGEPKMVADSKQAAYFKALHAQALLREGYKDLVLSQPQDPNAKKRKDNAVAMLDRAEGIYKELQVSLKSDPTELAQALYSIGLITEVKSLQKSADIEGGLMEAKGYYDKAAKDHPETAFGKLAKERSEKLGNEEELKKLAGQLANIAPDPVRPRPGMDFSDPAFQNILNRMSPEQRMQFMQQQMKMQDIHRDVPGFTNPE